MLRTLLPAIGLALILAAAATAAPAGVRAGLVNGSFEPVAGASAAPSETHAIPGWQSSPHGVTWLPASSGDFVAPNGDYVVRLDAEAGDAGCITQRFNTTPGESYDVAFWVGGRAPASHGRRATVRVDVAGTRHTVAVENASDEVLWQAHRLTFTATGTTTTLSFRGPRASAAAALLDGVAVWPAATALGGIPARDGADDRN